MRLTTTKMSGALVLLATCSMMACSKTHDREVQSRPAPSTAEQRRIDERRAEERRLEERKAERREEERADDRRQERLAADRREDERSAADRRDARSAHGAVAVDPAVKATAASALNSLAQERCDREVRCKNVGVKEKYRTRAECVAEMERDKRDDINSDVCTMGIRQKELTDCLQAIRDEGCGNPLDSLTRLNACRAGNLCAK